MKVTAEMKVKEVLDLGEHLLSAPERRRRRSNGASINLQSHLRDGGERGEIVKILKISIKVISSDCLRKLL